MTKTFNLDQIRAIINSMAYPYEIVAFQTGTKADGRRFIDKEYLIKRFEEAKA